MNKKMAASLKNKIVQIDIDYDLHARQYVAWFRREGGNLVDIKTTARRAGWLSGKLQSYFGGFREQVECVDIMCSERRMSVMFSIRQP